MRLVDEKVGGFWREIGAGAGAACAGVCVVRFEGADTRELALDCLATLAGVDRQSMLFGVGPHGKPFLTGSPWRFNFSHSHGVRLLALARAVEVGVDVERVRPLRRRAALLQRCFTTSEQQRLADAPDRELLRHWAAKEALVKAIGRGIAYGLRNIEIARSADGTLSIGRCEGVGGPAGRWQLQELPPIDDAVAMLVQPRPALPVECRFCRLATTAPVFTS
jgi:4'-phosphopantetheinyl transferase